MDISLQQLAYQLSNNTYQVYYNLYTSLGIVIRQRDYVAEYNKNKEKIVVILLFNL